MASRTKEATTAAKKRKLKFSDKELEVLTEKYCLHHEVLFGKAAMSVPDTHKNKFWLDIQTNAIGVSHRTIEEVRKQWYDLRSRTKERVAEQLKEAHGTGGGPSTVPPPTAIESMVETTLEPEAVVGIGGLSSSALRTSKSLPPVFTDYPSVERDDNATMTADEAVSISAGECSTTPIVHHARETTEETDVDNEAGNLTPGPQMGGSQPCEQLGLGAEGIVEHMMQEYRLPMIGADVIHTRKVPVVQERQEHLHGLKNLTEVKSNYNLHEDSPHRLATKLL
ncbi:t-SNARE domain-containing protein 1-like [Pleurodeles waltl]|uniref:t-SNARE domain-containing protein 1-like n=1 Tax=Pleurodeles waltl TaxID=8319 RepID=UPI003709B56E